MVSNYPEISIIIPLFNEESLVEKILSQLLEGLKNQPFSWEVILVDDGSTDKSLLVLEKYLKNEGTALAKQVQVQSYKPNKGRGFALRQGFSQAKGEYVITTEFDLSYGVDIIPSLYQTLKESKADIVIASPYSKGGKLTNVPLKRAFLSRMGNKIFKMAFGGRVSTSSGMTRGYKRSSLVKLPLSENGKEIHLEILSKAFSLDFMVNEIPATLCWSPERTKMAKKKSFNPVPLIKTHLLFSFFQRPILLIGSVAIFLLLAGLIMGGYSAALSISGEKMGSRPLTLVSIMLILFSTQIGCFLFLAYMIGQLQQAIVQMHSQIKNDSIKSPKEISS